VRKPLVAGNWKMNGSRAMARELLTAIKSGLPSNAAAEVAVCPPFVLLSEAAELLGGSALRLGAQDVSEREQGAVTGEISTEMLVDLGCDYVLVGHSERREYFAETSELVARKFARARNQGLRPILCVGESLEEREAGTSIEVVTAQLDAVLEHAGVQAFANAVVAYEPVWAIGTGLTASPEQAQEVHAAIRARIAMADAPIADGLRILYGGSMKPGNAAELLAQADIDGGLIGGAALQAVDFLAICAAAG